jgi:hypothetical protein
MEGLNDTENWGEAEEGTNLRSQNEQLVAKLLPFMERLENRMFEMETIMLRMENRASGMENRIEENKREILTSLTKDVEDRTNQQIEPSNNKVKMMSERTHGLIQPPTEEGQSDRSKSSQAQIERQSSSFHNDEDVERPAIPATQAQGAVSERFVASQEERVFNGDNSAERQQRCYVILPI